MERTSLGLTGSVILEGSNGEEKLLTARIDSGATSSSIDLTLAEKLKLGPTLRTRLVKSASGVKKRPIVLAKVNIAGTIIEAEFSLADRSHMTYQILIGQNVLKKGKFLIDPLLEAEK